MTPEERAVIEAAVAWQAIRSEMIEYDTCRAVHAFYRACDELEAAVAKLKEARERA